VDYVYQIERSALGQGSSVLFLDNEGAARRAQERAEQQMAYKLKTEIDAVPCPKCGWYQKPMVDLVRRQYRRWMKVLGVWLVALTFPVICTGTIIIVEREGSGQPTISLPVFLTLIAAFPVAGVALILARRGYDPNTQEATVRIEIGKSRGMLRADFEKRQGPPDVRPG
jgi:hypothetical protein